MQFYLHPSLASKSGASGKNFLRNIDKLEEALAAQCIAVQKMVTLGRPQASLSAGFVLLRRRYHLRLLRLKPLVIHGNQRDQRALQF